jgi:hypothetical protein
MLLVDTSSNLRAMIFQGTVVTPGNTVEVTFSGMTPRVSGSAQEWSDVTTVTDGAGSKGNVSTSISVGPLITRNANDVILAIGGHNLSERAASSPASPWLSLSGSVGVVPQLDPLYLVTASAGTFQASWTWPSSIDNGAAMVAIQATSH